MDFLKGAGFRLEMILPADSPATAILSKNSCFIRLEYSSRGFSVESVAAMLEGDDFESRLSKSRLTKKPFFQETGPFEGSRGVVFSRFGASGSWVSGRAGMLYRDLIPSRLGGSFIGSEIRICGGGPVDDYVHYHGVRFQVIFCKSGWVRVVYEDQGDPFIMYPGDCVLQPPNIRHRVLESSDGLEVVEISSPAVHPTFVEHEINLPNECIDTERLFGGHKFSRFISSERGWTDYKGWLTKDMGIGEATGGTADARLLRNEIKVNRLLYHSSEFLFWYLINGEIEIRGFERFRTGDSITLPPYESFDVSFSDGCEFLEVRVN